MTEEEFEKQESLSKKYWNDIVFKELSSIYLDLYKKEINLSSDINTKDFNKQIHEKRSQQESIVNYWNDNYNKFRYIEGKTVLFKLKQSGVLPDGFYATEFLQEEVHDVLNDTLEHVGNLTEELNKIKKREQLLIGVLVLIAFVLTWLF